MVARCRGSKASASVAIKIYPPREEASKQIGYEAEGMNVEQS
jgi:hypothetical protein